MYQLTVLGAGYEMNDLTLGAIDILKSDAKIVLHTINCGAAVWLDENGIPYETLDALYENAADFDEHVSLAAEHVLNLAERSNVVYVVFDLRDLSVKPLLKHPHIRLVQGAPTEGALFSLIDGQALLFDAASYNDVTISSARATIIREIATRELASEVKLKLMRRYPETSKISILQGDSGIANTELINLDRMKRYDHRTCAYIPAEADITRLTNFDFHDLTHIVHILRSPGGCPWDRKQTHATLRTNMVEEAYEAVDAINRNDMDDLYDELGDVLLQVSLHAEIAKEHGEFDIDDVTTAICQKMIHRHQHVFSNAKADTPDEVLSLWQKIKKDDKHFESQAEVLRSVTKSLPALMRAEKVQKRAGDVGFDWDNATEAFPKIAEESAELERAMSGDGDVSSEMGDLLFACVNVARLLKLDPELLLNAATDKFVSRFEKMERLIAADGMETAKMSLKELDNYWNRVKLSE